METVEEAGDRIQDEGPEGLVERRFETIGARAAGAAHLPQGVFGFINSEGRLEVGEPGDGWQDSVEVGVQVVSVAAPRREE